MKSNKTTQFIKKIQAFFGSVFSFPILPQKHFFRLVVASATFLVLVVVYHVYYFRTMLSYDIFQTLSAPATLPTIVNEKKLTDVLDRYQIKSKTQADLQANPTPVTDPSN